MTDFADRRDRLRKNIKQMGVQALLVTNTTNVTYLTGFTGEDSYLLVPVTGADIVISDARFTTQLEEECPGLERDIRKTGVQMLQSLATLLARCKLLSLAFEADSLTVGLRDRLAEKLPKVKLEPSTNAVEQLRMIKDKFEIAEIRQAIDYAQRGFAVLRATLQPEQTEKQVSDQLEHQMRQFGAKGVAFQSIVAAGERAALPHARPSSKKIGESPFLLVDWGASGRLYKSDLTRVLGTGKIPPKLERIYGVVLKAQLAGIDAIRPGRTGEEVDAAARCVIEAAGFGRQFGHGIGHGFGLDIHESPRMGKGAKGVLEPGMVITVEPGIYFPGFGGVRLEDDVLVTKTGYEVLTSLPKEWDDIHI